MFATRLCRLGPDRRQCGWLTKTARRQVAQGARAPTCLGDAADAVRGPENLHEATASTSEACASRSPEALSQEGTERRQTQATTEESKEGMSNPKNQERKPWHRGRWGARGGKKNPGDAPQLWTGPLDAAGNPAYKSEDVTPHYRKLLRQFHRNPESLGAQDLNRVVCGLPARFRITLSHEEVVRLLDSGGLDAEKVRHCSFRDLNLPIRRLLEEGETEKAVQLVEHLVKLTKFNQHTFAMFFDGCASRRDLTTALSYWVKWAKAGLLHAMGDASSCGLLKCVTRTNIERASDVMVVLHEWDAPMNNYCYNTLIWGFCEQGLLADAMDIFGLMQLAVRPKLQPDSFTYQHLLHGVEALQKWDMVEDLYRSMLRQELVPDELLVGAFLKCLTAAGELELAERVFFVDLKMWGMQPTQRHFNTLLIAHAHVGNASRCSQLLGMMLEAGCAPDSHSVVALLTAVSQSTDCTAAKVAEVLEFMEAHNIKRNTFICTSIMNAFRSCGDKDPLQRKALALQEYRGMKAAGIEVSAETINTVICVLSESDDVEGSLRMLNEMARMGIQPSSHTYTILSMVCANNGLVDKATELRELKESMLYLNGPLPANTRKGRPMY